MKFKKVLTPLLIILLLISIMALGAPSYVNLGPTSDIEGDIGIEDEIVCEGATADDFETTISITDPTADRTITVPDSDQTIGIATSIQDDLIVKADFADEDWGDISVSTNVISIDSGAVTYAKIQNVSATDKLLGRSSVGAGVTEEIACTSAGRALIDDADASTQRTTLGLIIGTNVLAEQTIGIADDNLLEVDDVDAADDEYAKFTVNGLEGRSNTEVVSDLDAALAEKTLKLLSATTVAFNADADTTIYTIPTGKRCVLSHAIVVAAGDAGATTTVSIGANGSETDFFPANTLSNLDAQYDAVILQPIPNTTPLKIKSYATDTVIEAQVANQSGAAGNTIYLFGILY